MTKPALANGAPRSDVDTNGDFGSCSRCQPVRCAIRLGCVLGSSPRRLKFKLKYQSRALAREIGEIERRCVTHLMAGDLRLPRRADQRFRADLPEKRWTQINRITGERPKRQPLIVAQIPNISADHDSGDDLKGKCAGHAQRRFWDPGRRVDLCDPSFRLIKNIEGVSVSSYGCGKGFRQESLQAHIPMSFCIKLNAFRFGRLAFAFSVGSAAQWSVGGLIALLLIGNAHAIAPSVRAQRVCELKRKACFTLYRGTGRSALVHNGLSGHARLTSH
jgi:hypothetical protein